MGALGHAAQGGAQGALNALNGGTDGVIGVINLPLFAFNPNPEYEPIQIPYWDWSKGLIAYEDPTDHEISKFFGGLGLPVVKKIFPIKLPKWSQGVKAPNCFPPQTLVATEFGLKPIAKINAGEKVWSYDFRGGSWCLSGVECRHELDYAGYLVTVHTDEGELTATAGHPFWVIQGDNLSKRPIPTQLAPSEDEDGTLPGRWVNAIDLCAEDELYLKDHGYSKIRSIATRHEQTLVYNLSIEDLHNFSVGKLQILVHNSSTSESTPIPPSRQLPWSGASTKGGEHGVLEGANFAQPKINKARTFSPEGQEKYSVLAGRPIKTVEDLVAAIQDGKIKPSQLPIDYVIIDGQKVILNTRTSAALEGADVPRSQWHGVDQTGVPVPGGSGGTTFDDLAKDQIRRNRLPTTGTPTPPK